MKVEAFPVGWPVETRAALDALVSVGFRRYTSSGTRGNALDLQQAERSVVAGLF